MVTHYESHGLDLAAQRIAGVLRGHLRILEFTANSIVLAEGVEVAGAINFIGDSGLADEDIAGFDIVD